MKQRKILKAIAITSTMIASTSSMATLNIYSNEALIQEKAQEKAQYSFTQQGVSPEETKVVQANVREMPLEMALETITNDGWKIQINKEAKDMPVSFEGGQSWPYIMERLSMDYKLKTHIDWKYRILTVYSPQQRNKAIADRREQLIEKEAKARQDFHKQMEEAKEQYKKQKEKMKDAQKKEARKDINEHQKSFKNSENKSSNKKHDKNYNELKKERKNKDIVKEHHQKALNSIDSPSVEQYKQFQQNQDGFPYQQLVEDAPFQHTVQKGDTLWDISDVYMNNPWFWPEIWYINPNVENPHLIYPGEKVIVNPKADKQ